MAGRILVVDDVATNRVVLKVTLKAARYEVLLAASGAEALEIAAREKPDVAILDMVMPGMSGAETCRRLRADPATSGIPAIIVTATDDQASRLEGLSAGADDFLTKPVEEVALLARVRSLLRARAEERDFEARGGWLDDGMALSAASAPAGFADAQAGFSGPGQARAPDGEDRVAAVSATREAAAALVGPMRLRFRGGVAAMDADDALEVAEAEAPDLVILDADAPMRGAGLRLMSDMRARGATRHAAFVVVIDGDDPERIATALDLGAADVVARPVEAAELAARVRTQLARKKRGDRMRRALDTGLQMAVTDPLTGLHNRRYGLAHLRRVAERCRVTGARAGVVMVDIDHFKAVNDTHGHDGGDRVLIRVAQELRNNLRSEDLVARLGGEEFLCILPEVDEAILETAAERLRRAIESVRVPLPNGAVVSVTTSLGTAVLGDGTDAPSLALAIADRALYAAKAGGRNRVRAGG